MKPNQGNANEQIYQNSMLFSPLLSTSFKKVTNKLSEEMVNLIHSEASLKELPEEDLILK